MEKNKKIAAVVVSYKNKEQTEKCLKCLENIYVFLHDNSKENLGFTKAYNLGIKELQKNFEYILLINSDCYIHENFVNNIVDFMDKNPKCGIAGVKQMSEDGETITHGGCLQAYPYGVHIGGKISLNQCDKNIMVPWVNGACFVARSKMIDEVGLMDENYFLIGSDSDWCYTARSRKWEVWYVCNAICTHEGKVSKKSNSEEFEDIKFLDMKYWESKWINGNLFNLLKEIN